MFPFMRDTNVTDTWLISDTSSIKLSTVPLPDSHSLVSFKPLSALISRPVPRYDCSASSALWSVSPLPVSSTTNPPELESNGSLPSGQTAMSEQRFQYFALSRAIGRYADLLQACDTSELPGFEPKRRLVTKQTWLRSLRPPPLEVREPAKRQWTQRRHLC